MLHGILRFDGHPSVMMGFCRNIEGIRRQISEDYDEEQEMEPRTGPTRETTPPLRSRSPRVRRQREKVVGFDVRIKSLLEVTVAKLKLDNQSIERDRLNGIRFVLDFVEFISFTFGDKEMISVIEAVSR
ncbi:hypothetical protein Tco_0505119 [Tanacetum coccineum]